MGWNLLTCGNAKTVKGQAKGYLTGILYLVPAGQFGLPNLCPNHSPGCKSACLFTAGRGIMPHTRDGRIRKTKLFVESPSKFVDMLYTDIIKLITRAKKLDLIPCVRLNGTSDIAWEKIKGTGGCTIMETFPNLQFYDYTKRPNRVTPPNYHLTFSMSENNLDTCRDEFNRGLNVTIVTRSPKDSLLRRINWFETYPNVIDGDENDLRFLDKPKSLVVLTPKGKAKHDHSGFVV
jgi:hypothetical protein